LVVVEIVEFCECGVGEKQKLQPAEKGWDVFLTRVVAPADVVGWQTVEVLLGEGEVAERVRWVGHQI
jgi:hypothetical protein